MCKYILFVFVYYFTQALLMFNIVLINILIIYLLFIYIYILNKITNEKLNVVVEII